MALTDNLSLYWKFEEEAGNFADASGNSLDGTPTSLTRNVFGKVDRSITLSGSSQWVDRASAAGLEMSNTSFSIAFWFKPTTVPSVSGSGDVLVAKNAGSPDQEYWIVVSKAAGDKLQFVVDFNGSGDTVAHTDGTALTAGTWYFVVAVFDVVNQTVGISLNGAAISTTSTGKATNTSIHSGSVSSFRLGAFSSGTFPADAEFDELAVWKRTLSASEITELYNSGSGKHLTTSTTNVSSIEPGGGGDFTSLAAWEAATQANISAANRIEVAELGDGNADSFVLDGWTTDSDSYVEIRAKAAARHSGVFSSSSGARVIGSTGGSEIREAHTRLKDIILSAPAAANVLQIVQNDGLIGILVDSCVFDGGLAGVVCTDGNSASPNEIRNCIIHGASGAGVHAQATGHVTVRNCTIAVDGTGIALQLTSGGSLTEQNNYLHANTAGNTYGGTGELSISKGANTATSDTEALTASLRSVAYSTANFQNVTNGSENLHIQTGTKLAEAAQKLASEFTNDIDGAGTRPDASDSVGWDIGADQKSAPTQPYVPPSELAIPTRGFRGLSLKTGRAPDKFSVTPAALPKRRPRGPDHLLDWLGGD